MLTGLRIENNLYTQIGIILLIALSAKNAILIVEVALELHVRDRKPLLESAVEAARARFRPILMTSFAFILGVVPLVLATGAGANARKSIGITVFSGMLASTCLAVLFVPTFFVVVQRFENWLAERKKRKAGVQTVPQAPTVHAQTRDRRVGKAKRAHHLTAQSVMDGGHVASLLCPPYEARPHPRGARLRASRRHAQPCAVHPRRCFASVSETALAATCLDHEESHCLHPHHPLAAVLAGEQADQRFRRVLDAVDHVFLHFQFA